MPGGGDVVITGAGLVCSLGGDLEEVWSALLSSQHGLRPVEGFPAEGPPGRMAAQFRGPGPEVLGLARSDARIMGRHSCMLVRSARDAHRRAGLDARTVPREEKGFFAGMGMVDYRVEDLLPALLASLDQGGGIDYDRFFENGYREIHPLWPLSMLNNISFCQAAVDLGIAGENAVFSPHADSGALAIAEGARTVSAGRARVVLAGGVSEVVSPSSLARADSFGMPGTILGEGCGIVCLESRSFAEARGARYGTVLLGYGVSCGKEKEAAGPSVGAIVQAIRQALDIAGLPPAAVDLVIAHGDGTLSGAGNEAEAIRAVFPANPDCPAVYASKAAIGNCLAAGPAIDVILGARMIEQGVIPAVAGAGGRERSAGLGLAAGEALRAGPRKILVNALSPEGQCACLLIGAAD